MFVSTEQHNTACICSVLSTQEYRPESYQLKCLAIKRFTQELGSHATFGLSTNPPIITISYPPTHQPTARACPQLSTLPPLLYLYISLPQISIPPPPPPPISNSQSGYSCIASPVSLPLSTRRGSTPRCERPSQWLTMMSTSPQVGLPRR